jgi:hypothetical protein
MSPRLIVTIIRHLHSVAARIADHPLTPLETRREDSSRNFSATQPQGQPRLDRSQEACIDPEAQELLRDLNLEYHTEFPPGL